MSAEASSKSALPGGSESRRVRLANLNPVMTKELRGRMRGWRATILLTVYLFILCGITMVLYAASAEASRFSSPVDSRVGQALFYGIVIFETVLVALLAPAFTAGVITGEREKQTYDLLMTTMLKPLAIISGKLGSALAWLVLLVLAIVPLEALAYVFGGVAPEEIVLSTLVLLFAALLYGAIGIFWSTVARSTVAATVLSYATLLFLLGGVPGIWGLIFAFVQAASYSGNGQGFTPDALTIYLSGAWLCTNPFIAMGISQAALNDGQPLFFYTDNTLINGQHLLVIHPWLYFCLFAVLMSALLILLAVRILPPTRRRPAPRYLQPAAVPAGGPAEPIAGATDPAAPIAGATAPAPAADEFSISPQAAQTLARRDTENISGEVRLRDEDVKRET